MVHLIKPPKSIPGWGTLTSSDKQTVAELTCGIPPFASVESWYGSELPGGDPANHHSDGAETSVSVTRTVFPGIFGNIDSFERNSAVLVHRLVGSMLAERSFRLQRAWFDADDIVTGPAMRHIDGLSAGIMAALCVAGVNIGFVTRWRQGGDVGLRLREDPFIGGLLMSEGSTEVQLMDGEKMIEAAHMLMRSFPGIMVVPEKRWVGGFRQVTDAGIGPYSFVQIPPLFTSGEIFISSTLPPYVCLYTYLTALDVDSRAQIMQALRGSYRRTFVLPYGESVNTAMRRFGEFFQGMHVEENPA